MERYRQDLIADRLTCGVDQVRRELVGRDLMCWCALTRPCRADLLPQIANSESVEGSIADKA